jgi:serine/threonine-protein phosphatase 6 regulatory ankyrin repeat subunit A
MNKLDNLFYSCKTIARSKKNNGENLSHVQLYRASKKGDIKKVKQLIEQGEDVNKIFRDQTLLSSVISKGQVDMAKLLIVKGMANVNKGNAYGTYPLHVAIEKKNQPMVELLMSHGVNINKKGRDGKTPFQMAVNRKSPGIAELIIRAIIRDKP